MNKAVWFAALALLPGMALADQPNEAQQQAAKSFDENFKHVDTNQDGLLSMEETEKNAPGLALRFALIDANHDGQLSKQEILNFVEAQRKEAANRFKHADKNGNGALSKEEAKELPGVLAHFDEMDTNHDGELTPQEIGEYVRAQAKARRAQAAAESKNSK